MRVHLAGGARPETVKYWRDSLKGCADFKVHGWMSSPEISKYLQALDLGITTIPQHALGKSSSIAVFAEHRLPFAAPSKGLGGIGFFAPPTVLQADIFRIEPDYVSIERHICEFVEKFN